MWNTSGIKVKYVPNLYVEKFKETFLREIKGT